MSQGGAQDHLQWLMRCLSSAGGGLLYGFRMNLLTLSQLLFPPHALCSNPDESQAQVGDLC